MTKKTLPAVESLPSLEPCYLGWPLALLCCAIGWSWGRCMPDGKTEFTISIDSSHTSPNTYMEGSDRSLPGGNAPNRTGLLLPFASEMVSFPQARRHRRVTIHVQRTGRRNPVADPTRRTLRLPSTFSQRVVNQPVPATSAVVSGHRSNDRRFCPLHLTGSRSQL